MRPMLPWSVLLLASIPTAAFAQDADVPLCTDRPAKSFSPCTVPRGAVQVEADIGAWTLDRNDGMRTDTVIYASPVVKYGLGDSSDIEIGLVPYQTIRTRIGGSRDTVGGLGNLTVMFKQRLTAPDAKVTMAFLPFVTIPTARDAVDGGGWQGGLVVPVAVDLGRGYSLGLSPEIDLTDDADGAGSHTRLIGAAVLAVPLTGTLTANAELWTAQDFDPSGTVRQYSADAAIAWLPAPLLQIDAGANVGLNDATPDLNVYVGVSTRF